MPGKIATSNRCCPTRLFALQLTVDTCTARSLLRRQCKSTHFYTPTLTPTRIITPKPIPTRTLLRVTGFAFRRRILHRPRKEASRAVKTVEWDGQGPKHAANLISTWADFNISGGSITRSVFTLLKLK
ncbi:unnamed protein product [Protopolystoma xenopodis]|uniref:Uncharacterized protein n=1 Tax=Protopolystoma xenopodis TaxID=117903 RepID=A0A3S5CG87_9PLAT|nr:unnamed protein product [Protopolystoma xenopodis]